MNRQNDILNESELTDTIHIDISSIPDYVKEELAAATYQCLKRFFKQSESREILAITEEEM